jgi:hypothetical protein
MPPYAVQCSLPFVTGLPADVATNTFHFDAATVGDLEDVDGALRAFYEGFTGVLSPRLNGHLRIRAYDLNDPEPRVPVWDNDDTLSALGATAMPEQVALVMSFQRPVVSGSPQAQRRNRVFLGPFAVAANDAATARPTVGTLTNIRVAGETLLASSIAAPNWDWIVYSPVGGVGAVDNGWVDNRWDTQRRRLEKALNRLTFEA